MVFHSPNLAPQAVCGAMSACYVLLFLESLRHAVPFATAGTFDMPTFRRALVCQDILYFVELLLVMCGYFTAICWKKSDYWRHHGPWVVVLTVVVVYDSFMADRPDRPAQKTLWEFRHLYLASMLTNCNEAFSTFRATTVASRSPAPKDVFLEAQNPVSRGILLILMMVHIYADLVCYWNMFLVKLWRPDGTLEIFEALIVQAVLLALYTHVLYFRSCATFWNRKLDALMKEL